MTRIQGLLHSLCHLRHTTLTRRNTRCKSATRKFLLPMSSMRPGLNSNAKPIISYLWALGQPSKYRDGSRMEKTLKGWCVPRRITTSSRITRLSLTGITSSNSVRGCEASRHQSLPMQISTGHLFFRPLTATHSPHYRLTSPPRPEIARGRTTNRKIVRRSFQLLPDLQASAWAGLTQAYTRKMNGG